MFDVRSDGRNGGPGAWVETTEGNRADPGGWGERENEGEEEIRFTLKS